MKQWLCSLVLFCAFSAHAAETVTMLNASYDPTRELYAEYNRAFVKEWQNRTGQTVRMRMAHGGSGKQARAVTDGLPADVVTLALGADIDAIAARGLLRADWENALPHGSAPYRSTIVLLVRKGNPKQIQDWDDLARAGVKVLTPNPKTSGGARWNYLAAWAYAQRTWGGGKQAERFMRQWLANVIIFDTGARAATTNFVRRHQGDVLITWENEAYIAQKYFGADQFEIIYPSVSMLCEPPVAVVDAVVEKRGTRDLAETYLAGLYDASAQAMIARHFFRPVTPQATSPLPALDGTTLVRVGELGGWKKAQAQHFAEGGTFDRFTARGQE
jgi:sulfate/thiosulfate-binding protein